MLIGPAYVNACKLSQPLQANSVQPHVHQYANNAQQISTDFKEYLSPVTWPSSVVLQYLKHILQ